jgi:hypothetical protein
MINDARCTCEIKARIVMVKAALNRKNKNKKKTLFASNWT